MEDRTRIKLTGLYREAWDDYQRAVEAVGDIQARFSPINAARLTTAEQEAESMWVVYARLKAALEEVSIE